MTPERLAEIEQVLEQVLVLDNDPAALIAKELLTALREAQQTNETAEKGGEILQSWYEECQRERDTLQRRVEALERVAHGSTG